MNPPREILETGGEERLTALAFSLGPRHPRHVLCPTAESVPPGAGGLTGGLPRPPVMGPGS